MLTSMMLNSGDVVLVTSRAPLAVLQDYVNVEVELWRIMLQSFGFVLALTKTILNRSLSVGRKYIKRRNSHHSFPKVLLSRLVCFLANPLGGRVV